MRLSDLSEGRDAPLYHGTPMDLFFQIMDEDTLHGGEPDDSIGHERLSVRLTREYNTALAFSNMNWPGDFGAVIVFDQRRLTQRYKMVPFADVEFGAARAHNHGEAEEVVLTDKIQPLSRMMAGFYANPEDIELMVSPRMQQQYSFMGWDNEKFQAMGQFIMDQPKRSDIK